MGNTKDMQNMNNNVAWYPPRNLDESEQQSVQNVQISIPERSQVPNSASLWKNWNAVHGVEDERNVEEGTKEMQLTYLVSNDWRLIPKDKAKDCRRYSIHGVEVKKLGKDHFLSGEYGLFSTKKFSKFDIIGEYTGIVVGNNVSGHYVAALEDKTFEESLGVDAQKSGNEMRFINSHLNIAFSANVSMRTAYVNSYPHILIVCTQDIEPGDELLLDYGAAYNNAYLIPQKSHTVVTSSLSFHELMHELPMLEEEQEQEEDNSTQIDADSCLYGDHENKKSLRGLSS